MNKNEALFLSLKEINRLCDTGKITGETINTIQAIKAALEAKDEPVAWKWHQAPVKTQWSDDMVVADIAIDKDHTVSIYCERDQTAKVEAMFTPLQQEAKDEPVAWMREDGTLHFADKNIFYVGQPFYTTPPQRTWVGLTNEEREQVINANTATGLWHMAKDLEAKLKEKNT